MGDVLPAFSGVEVDRSLNWLFALMLDGLPILGEADTVEGLWIAVGSWVTQAGGVGDVMPEWIARGTPMLADDPIDLQNLHIDRFRSEPESRAVLQDQYAQQYDAIFGFSHQASSEGRYVEANPAAAPNQRVRVGADN